MRAARELAKRAEEHKSGREGVPETKTEETPKARSGREIRGQRAAGKKGETKEAQKQRVRKRWKFGIWTAVANYRKFQLDDLRKFRYATKLPNKNEKGRPKFGKLQKVQELEDKLELIKLREEQLKFVNGENLRLQKLIGIALVKAGSYMEAQKYLERVCQNERSYKESAEEKSARVKAEMAIAKEKGRLQIQLEFEANLIGGKEKGQSAEGKEEQEKEAEKARREKETRERELENEAKEEENQNLHEGYDAHLWAARCAVGLFKQTHAHYHLENAYGHYQHSIECMTVPNEKYDLSTNLRLPVVYFELGELFELFGSMGSALNIYTRCMSEFPHSRVYFDTMYRAALVGRHMTGITTNEKGREDMLNRCIDMLQFLLEALPEHINEANIIYLYARTLEQSSDPAIRYRSVTAYESLFTHLHEAKLCGADEYAEYKLWQQEPTSWLKLSRYIKDYGEGFLAIDAYETYVNKLNSRKAPGKPVEFYVETSTLMEIARNYASYQNYKLATKYAELALNKDRLNKEVRALLSSYSQPHAAALKKEVDSINILHQRWTERAWTNKSRQKLKSMEIERLEKKYDKNVYDKEARRLLSYYDRDRWRAKFMFEAECAIRVQRFVRNKFICWKVQEKFRARYLARASAAYSFFNRFPYDPANRLEIRSVNKSRFCPRKHIIRKLRATLELQDNAAGVMIRFCKAYLMRQGVRQGIRRTKKRKAEHEWRCALRMQLVARKFLAIRKVNETIREWAKKAVAAVVVQKFWRWRERTFQHAVTKIVTRFRKAKLKATMTFTTVLRYHVMRKIRAKRGEEYAKTRAQQLALEQRRRKKVYEQRQNGSRVITRFFKSLKADLLSRSCSLAIRSRREAGWTQTLTPLLLPFDAGRVSYCNPGFSQSQPAFRRALLQRVVYISAGFELSDSILLANVLKHSSCQVHSLFFHDVPHGGVIGLEEHVLPALRKCTSLRRIAISGGSSFPASFFEALFHLVQVENPRIVDLYIEKANHHHGDNIMRRYTDDLAFLSSSVMKDFFNYSVPGLRVLSLHGCYLRDEDLEDIKHGLEVNSSLQRLALSMNIITDLGLYGLIQSATTNEKKGNLRDLELGYNLLVCSSSIVELLHQKIITQPYWPAKNADEERFLTLHLEGNPIPKSRERLFNSFVDKVPDATRGLRVNFQRASKVSAVWEGEVEIDVFDAGALSYDSL